MWYIIVAVLGLILIFLCVCFWAYYKTYLYGKEHPAPVPYVESYGSECDSIPALIEEFMALPFEEHSIKSYDGKHLFGRYYYAKEDAPLIIMFHGYQGSPRRDFCGSAKPLLDLGYNILTIDQRSHGKSDGHSITFGIKERNDCLSWAKYAKENLSKDNPIFLMGISMGGATVLMASNMELPEAIKGIIADCPYSTPKDIIKKECKNMGYNPKLVFPLIVCGGWIFGRLNIFKYDSLSAVKECELPILLIHGTNDMFVPCEMSKEIYKGCKNATLEIFEGAAHGVCCLKEPERYKNIIADFILKNK
ncbi:MAG: alpha/beta fold hydrolase [Clostridia bacterium]|nr:alpha/beta fold hydrolase [Clostridia bacterium]